MDARLGAVSRELAAHHLVVETEAMRVKPSIPRPAQGERSGHDRLPSHISKMVVSTVRGGGPRLTVDSTTFELVVPCEWPWAYCGAWPAPRSGTLYRHSEGP